MYGWLSLDEHGFLNLHPPEWDLESAPDGLTDERLAQRTQRGALAVARAFAAAGDGALREAAQAALARALRHVDDELVDHVVAMTIAFHQQHRLDHAAIEQACRAIVQREFQPVPAHAAHPAIAALTERLRDVAFLFPRERRAVMVNDHCSYLRISLIGRDALGGVAELAALSSACSALAPRLEALPPEQHDAVRRTVCYALGACAHDALRQVLDDLERIFEAQRTEVLVDLSRHVMGTGDAEGLLPVYQYEALRDGLRLAVEWPDLSGGEVALAALFAAQWRQRRDDRIEMLDTVAALDAGVNLGPHDQSSRQALQAFRQAQAERRERRGALLVDQADANTAVQPLVPGVPSREELQALSVLELAEWIEGPVSGPQIKALDPRRVVERSRAQPKPGARADAKAATQPPARPGAPQRGTGRRARATLDVQHVQRVSQEGVGTAAQYLADELEDLIGLGKVLNVDAAVLRRAHGEAQQIEPLSRAPHKFTPQQAHELLSGAEAAIAAVRASVTVVKARNATQARFSSCLYQVLTQEPLYLGRRDGGVIACALQRDDWSWVVERFHGRWFAGARHLLAEGRPRMLADDEALAFYVTATSLSGYAFDVTIHLWRRLPGSHGRPALPLVAGEPHARMDAQNWFDTRVTCCVLHVPHGAPAAQQPRKE